MNIHNKVLDTLAYDWKPYANLSNDKLEKKIDLIYTVNNAIFIFGIISAIVFPILINYLLEYLAHPLFLAYKVLLYIVLSIIMIAGTFYIMQGNEELIEKLLPISDEITNLKLKNLTRLSNAAQSWENHTKEVDREIRLYDVEIMEAIKDLEDYEKRKESIELLQELAQVKSITKINFKEDTK